MKNNKKVYFRRIAFNNRWKEKYTRSYSWVIFGVQQWYAGPEDFCYKFCFFGFDIMFWFYIKYL